MDTDPPIRAELVKRGARLRVIRVTGSVEFTLEYDGRDPARERVFIHAADGTASLEQLGRTRRYHLVIPTLREMVTGELDVRSTPLSLSLRLKVGQTVVYTSGRYGRLKRVALLPIPDAPANSADQLPLPSSDR